MIIYKCLFRLFTSTVKLGLEHSFPTEPRFSKSASRLTMATRVTEMLFLAMLIVNPRNIKRVNVCLTPHPGTNISFVRNTDYVLYLITFWRLHC